MTFDEKIKESKEQAARYVSKAEALLEKLKNDASDPNDIKEGEQLLADLAKIRTSLQTGVDALKKAKESLPTRVKSDPIQQRWEEEISSKPGSAESVDIQIVRVHTALKVKLLETTNNNLQSQLSSQATLLQQLQEQMQMLQNNMLLSNAAQPTVNQPSSLASAPVFSASSTSTQAYLNPLQQPAPSSVPQPINSASQPAYAPSMQMAYPPYMLWSQQIKLDIRKFDGNPSNFLTFWQQFRAIHEDIYMPKQKKLMLLIDSTTGRARSTIERYSLIDENYDHVVRLLREKFGDADKAITKLVTDLSKLPLRGQPGNTLNTMDDMHSILTQLEIHGENVNSKLYHTSFVDRLPKEIFTRISLTGGIPKTMEAVRARAYEVYNDVENDKEYEARVADILRSNKGSSNKTWDHDSTRPDNDMCVFCDKHPAKYECQTVTDVADRKDILFKSGRCLYCFSDDHKANLCYDRPTCSKCGGTHNSFLCQSSRSKRLETPKKEKPTTVASAIQPKTNNATSANDILLITANTKVQNPATKASRKAVIFIDTGSEASFIHRKLARQLRLKPECQVTLNIKPFEAAEMPLKTTQTTVRLRLADDTWKPLKVYIVDNLIGKVKRADSGDKASPSIREETPDILIGMDQLAEVSKLQMQLDNATGKPFFETSFGNVLAGPFNKSSSSAARSIKVNASTVTKNDQPTRASNSIFKLDNVAVPASVHDIILDVNTTRQEAEPSVQSDENDIKDDETPAATRLRQQSSVLITYDATVPPLINSTTEQVASSEETTNNEGTVDGRPLTTVSSRPNPAYCLQSADHCKPANTFGTSTNVKTADNNDEIPPEAEPPEKFHHHSQISTAKDAEPSSSPSSLRREVLLPKVSQPHPNFTSDLHAKPASWHSRSSENRLQLRAHVDRELHACELTSIVNFMHPTSFANNCFETNSTGIQHSNVQTVDTLLGNGVF